VADKAGTTTKKLSWAPAPDGNVYMVSGSATETGANGQRVVKQATVAVSKDELYVLQALAQGSMVFMFGFDAALLGGGVALAGSAGSNN
jgi:hypothetical protein